MEAPAETVGEPADPTAGWIPTAAGEGVRLVAMGALSLEALDHGARDRLADLTRLRWPVPIAPPPLVEDHLAFLADRVRVEGPEGGWWNWAIAEDSTAAGMLGCSGPLTDDGVAEVGYTLYEPFRGRGLASAALRLAIPLILSRPGARLVRATCPVDNPASRRVAERAGLRVARTGRSAEVGATLVLEGP